MDSTLVKLIGTVTLQSVDLIKTNAPLLWEMTRHRIFVLAVGRLVMAGIMLMLSFLAGGVGLSLVTKDGEEIAPVFFFLGFATTIIAICFAYCGVTSLYSLDYATAEKIISLMR